MNKETKNWIDMATYDLETADQMYITGRYVYVIFMCHLAIEKILKAVICEVTVKVPPKTHDLIYLVELGSVQLSEKLHDFLGIINNAAVVTRYPEDLARLVQNYPREIALQYFEKTKEVVGCIIKDSRLK